MVVMSFLAPILFFTLLGLKNTAAAVRPIVTLEPNWNNVYAGDRVTLSCSVGSAADNYRRYSYTWYKDENIVMYEKSKTFIVADSGVYKCSVEYNIYSDPVRLHVISKEATSRPVVILSPNWNKVYSGDKVTLSCNLRSAEARKYNFYYYWNKNNKYFTTGESTEFTAYEENSGVYMCYVNSVYSLPVQLDVVHQGFLILQTPPDIVEGDSLSLRCHSQKTYDNNNIIYYYKGDVDLTTGDNILYIPNVTAEDTGNYRCKKHLTIDNNDEWKTAETFISVQDLFTTPKIENNRYNLQEGGDMTVRCDTRLNPLRGGTELHYAFYIDEWTVQEFSVSDTYRVRSAQLEHSGKYTCEVRTATDTVRKMSDMLSIQIGGAVVRPVVTLSPNWNHLYIWDSVTLSCSVGSVEVDSYWYKDEQWPSWKKKPYTITMTKDNTGTYKCSADTNVYSHPVRLHVIANGKPNRPVVTLSPNWGNIFENEIITMTCNIAKSIQNYAWFKDGKQISRQTKQEFKISSWDSGNYQCGSGTDNLSSSVRLEVIRNAYLILQAPSDVIEGDSFDLRCHRRTSFKDEVVTFFYKDNENLKYTNYILHIKNVNTTMSGTYKCKKNLDSYGWVWAETYISVRDLFTTPKIKSTPGSGYLIREGDYVTLTCETRLNPLRENTALHYAFYRDGRTVQEFSGSDTYTVQSAQLEYSGNYTCEVRTMSDTVKKNSNVLSIQIQELFPSPQITVSPSLTVEEGEQVTLECTTGLKENSIGLSYIFYKDSQDIQRADMTHKYVIGKAGVEHTGSYHCSVQSKDGKVRKNSTNVHIHVQDPVSGVSITVDKDHKDFVHGEPLMLNCSVEKGTSPVFRWLHNETVVDKDSKCCQLRNNGTILYIESLQSHHVGTYTCNVSNRLLASSVETFLIRQILENQSLGSSIVWLVLGIVALILLFAVILMFINRDKVSSLFPLLNRHHKQQNSESTFHTDNPRDEGGPAAEGTNRPDEIDSNQQLYGNVFSRSEENDVCYSYIDIRKKKGPANTKDELSVVYAVLQPPGTSKKTQATPERDDSAEVYQNLDTKRH